MLGGTRSESWTHNDIGTGTIIVNGSDSEAYVHNDSRSGTIILSGEGEDRFEFGFKDSRSGTVILGGTAEEVLQTVWHDAVEGIVTVSGSGKDKHVRRVRQYPADPPSELVLKYVTTSTLVSKNSISLSLAFPSTTLAHALFSSSPVSRP